MPRLCALETRLRAAALDRPVMLSTSDNVKVERRRSYSSVMSWAARGPTVFAGLYWRSTL